MRRSYPEFVHRYVGIRFRFGASSLEKSMNFQHEVIKQLVAMNVQVHKMDSKPEILSKIVALKWDDCKLVIEFLVQKAGVKVEVSFSTICDFP